MKSVDVVILTMGVWLLGFASARALPSQAAPQGQPCTTEGTIVTSILQDLATTVSTVKKESLDDFEREFHQQACISKLSICLETVQELLTCLDKAAHDPAATKAQADACKAKQQTYGKLKTALQQYLTQLKATSDPKTAKADIEKFIFTH